MLFSMKFNPSLVTVTKEREERCEQWMKKAAHDIVAECASLSLDSTESTQVRLCDIHIHTVLSHQIRTKYSFTGI